MLFGVRGAVELCVTVDGLEKKTRGRPLKVWRGWDSTNTLRSLFPSLQLSVNTG